MGTLSSELGPHLERIVEQPRVYADANIPNGVVEFMRHTLGWDVLFVLEHDDLRRAPDIQHYRLARQLGRTLVTLDRDYTDDRRFPLPESPGVIVFSAPDERWLRTFLSEADRTIFRDGEATAARPLEGRKLFWQLGGADERGDGARGAHR
jgi:predicted nuclease of predicted toxin-antitoxin system